jgi:hypothetical protein
MSIKLYGSAATRAGRTLWGLSEVGVPFEHIMIEMSKQKSVE